MDANDLSYLAERERLQALFGANMVWSVNDPRGQSSYLDGKIAVSFKKDTSPGEVTILLAETYKATELTVEDTPVNVVAFCTVPVGTEDQVIAELKARPDVEDAEHILSVIHHHLTSLRNVK